MKQFSDILLPVRWAVALVLLGLLGVGAIIELILWPFRYVYYDLKGYITGGGSV